MIRLRGAVVVCAVAAAALALPGVAAADTQNVSIHSGAFGPMQLSVLAGDTVGWNNASLQTHTVTARDGSFGSALIGLGGSFSQAFPNAGTFAYYCQVHPFMTGEVDVFDVLLHAPADPVGRGSPVPLDGRARPGTSTVEIQADAGSGFTDVATAAVDAGGAFHTTVPALTSAKYRAVAGAGASPPVQVLVIDRKLTVHVTRRGHGHGDLVRVRAEPADPGAIVVLQLDLRERFGWWPASRRRLDSNSSAVFRAPAGARARVALTLPDGWTPVVISAPRRLPR
jgi:plastocyanin